MRQIRNTPAGFADLGPIQIPPLPTTVVLTDITTGTQYALSYDGVRLQLKTLDLVFGQLRKGVVYYAAGEGPAFVVGNGQFKIVVDQGRLALLYEAFPIYEAYYSTALVYARNLLQSAEVTLTSSDPLTARLQVNL